MARELELKYKATAPALAVLQKNYAPFTQITMETAYYDTPGGDLSRRKWMLRRRLENGVSVCTLKTPLPDGSRGEWEVCRDTIQEGVLELCKLDIPAEFSVLTAAGLVQTCAAQFTRLARTLTLKDCTLELALDRGAFLAPGREAAFAEIELEYKSGEESAFRAFSQALAEAHSLEEEPKSKAQRAFALISK